MSYKALTIHFYVVGVLLAGVMGLWFWEAVSTGDWAAWFLTGVALVAMVVAFLYGGAMWKKHNEINNLGRWK